MNRILTAACLAAAAVLTLTACDPATGDGKSVQPTVSDTTAAIPTTPVGTLPSLIGKPLPAAQDIARAAGFTNVSSHDATGANRAQIVDGHWKVCFQQPGPGAADPATPVGLAVVKTAEICPTADGTPAPTPTPAPTATTPMPKPTPTHQSASTAGGSTGGSSTGGSDYTDPPLDNHGGATALCNDGTLSFAAHHQGACSHHGGVAIFYK